MAAESGAAVAEERRRKGRWKVVGLLSLLSGISFLDKLILAIIAQPIAHSLTLTDIQLGMLIGPAFAILYAIAGLPIAHLVDNRNRRMIVFLGAMLWSSATIFSGFAHNFHALAIGRSFVAVGEAVLMPAAISLMADLFEPQERRLPVSLFLAATAAMSSGAYIAGGLIFGMAGGLASEWGTEAWRLTLFLVGLPGLAAALLFLLGTKEPVRRHHADPDQSGAGMREFLAELWRGRRLYVSLLLSNAGFGFFIYSMLAWIPTILIRAHGFDPARAGVLAGSIMTPFTLLSIFLWPGLSALIDRRRPGMGIPVVLMAASVFAIIPFMITPSASSAAIFLIGAGMAAATSGAWGPLTPLAFQNIAPSRMVGRMTALNLLIVNILGYGLGPVATVWLGSLKDRIPVLDALGGTSEPLGWGLAFQGAIGLVVMFAATPFFLGAMQRRHAS